jgi:hypothetical protein
VTLKLVLNNSKGRIYREIRVPSNYTFHRLHLFIQYVFIWGDCHMHQAEAHRPGELYKSKSRRNEVKNWGLMLVRVHQKGDRYRTEFAIEPIKPEREVREGRMTLGEV